MLRIRTCRVLCASVLALSLLPVPGPPAAAAPAACGPPVASATRPGYTVADPDCDLDGTPFAALADGAGRPLSTVRTGILDGAAYRIEVPRHWRGDLVIYAHGFRGSGTTVWVDNPALRAHHIARGFAWAASSYQTNGYDVGQGVRDSHALIAAFASATGRRARNVFLTGTSMGGHVTAAAIEHFPRSYAGAMPYCGVLGDAELFDYFLDANVTAAALAGAPIEFPRAPGPEFIPAYGRFVQSFLPALGSGWGPGTPPELNRRGRQWAGVVEQRSGGTRPGFDRALDYWNSAPSIAPLTSVPFLFGLYPGLSGGTQQVAEGNVTSNRSTRYQMDGDPRLSRAERWLNAEVLRVSRTDRPSRDLSGVPAIAGRPRVPVLSLHTIGDLFVPLSMAQVYAERARENGRGSLFVSRAIRALGHCEFGVDELKQGFDDLVGWVRTGRRPAGDAILDRRRVAADDFGCRFTLMDRANFGAPCHR